MNQAYGRTYLSIIVCLVCHHRRPRHLGCPDTMLICLPTLDLSLTRLTFSAFHIKEPKVFLMHWIWIVIFRQPSVQTSALERTHDHRLYVMLYLILRGEPCQQNATLLSTLDKTSRVSNHNLTRSVPSWRRIHYSI